ncbi:MAG: hypothetical protein GWP16_03290 [Nitrospirae bacterium]|nr:hypothetical protein [Nitrospirota bacterium]
MLEQAGEKLPHLERLLPIPPTSGREGVHVGVPAEHVDTLSAQVIGIRSFGCDGQEGPDTNPYEMGPFVTTSYEEDIVWADGFFVQSGARVD